MARFFPAARLPLLFLLLCASHAGLAQVYKWVDERGVTHYGEKPPDARKAVEVKDRLALPPGPRAPAAADSSREERDFQSRRIEREQAEARDLKRGEQAKQRCARERQRLALLKTARRVRTGVDAKGDPTYMSDAEHEAAIAKQEAAVARSC